MTLQQSIERGCRWIRRSGWVNRAMLLCSHECCNGVVTAEMVMFERGRPLPRSLSLTFGREPWSIVLGQDAKADDFEACEVLVEVK